MTIYGAEITNIRYHDGGLDELVELMEDTARTRPGLAVYRAIITMTHALGGRHDQARRGLDLAQEAGFPARRDLTLTITLSSWADAAARTRHSSAAALRELLVPFHDLVITGQVTVQPAVANVLGRLDHALGRYDDAEQWFTEADGIHRRMESPLLVAYSDAGMAALLADRGRPGDAEQARALAERALAAATAGGLGYIEADVRAVLDQLDRLDA